MLKRSFTTSQTKPLYTSSDETGKRRNVRRRRANRKCLVFSRIVYVLLAYKRRSRADVCFSEFKACLLHSGEWHWHKCMNNREAAKRNRSATADTTRLLRFSTKSKQIYLHFTIECPWKIPWQRTPSLLFAGSCALCCAAVVFRCSRRQCGIPIRTIATNGNVRESIIRISTRRRMRACIVRVENGSTSACTRVCVRMTLNGKWMWRGFLQRSGLSVLDLTAFILR